MFAFLSISHPNRNVFFSLPGAPRCKYATERCLEEEPELIHVSDTQQVRCFYAKKEDRHAK